jgi:NAD(P)-dependent dehydrogenase (short-subunit alcohol dehydrogenase family)
MRDGRASVLSQKFAAPSVHGEFLTRDLVPTPRGLDRFVRRARRGVEPLPGRLRRAALAGAVVARRGDALGALQVVPLALPLFGLPGRRDVGSAADGLGPAGLVRPVITFSFAPLAVRTDQVLVRHAPRPSLLVVRTHGLTFSEANAVARASNEDAGCSTPAACMLLRTARAASMCTLGSTREEGNMTIELRPLNEQVTVITGASSGIGLATAEAGAKLVLAARSGRTLAEIAKRLDAGGTDVVPVTADVADADAVKQIAQVAQVALARFGAIDTWVNNAEVSLYGRLDEVSQEDARRLFDVDFWGVVHGSLAALDIMRERGGAIINVGSEVSDAVVPLRAQSQRSDRRGRDPQSHPCRDRPPVRSERRDAERGREGLRELTRGIRTEGRGARSQRSARGCELVQKAARKWRPARRRCA